MNSLRAASPFNSALEAGLRVVVLLTSIYPRAIDLQSLVDLDFLAVHSADAGGPTSLHPALPFRSGELVVRRGVLERGLMLMMSRGMVARNLDAKGFKYIATDGASPFLEGLQSGYVRELRLRADWVASQFGDLDANEVSRLSSNFFRQWSAHFHVAEKVDI